MFIGLLGTVLPVLPGVPVIFLAALGYGIYNDFTDLPVVTIIIMFILMALTFAIDYLAGVVGAKRYGSSRWGVWGSIIGTLFGLFFLPFGVILGPLFGALAGEIIAGKKPGEAFKIAWGTLVGMAGGAVLKIALGLVMMIYFLVEVLWR